ncbi:MAG TPA: PQQ-binding-like beta-propeller repeat protein [Puia sp.]|nr:PQQ-binding-like beta-propeller repeat protein [Puia sp.]
MNRGLLLPFILILLFTLPACHKNNNPAPTTKDSTVTTATDSAAGIVVVTYNYNAGAVTNALLCFNADGTQRWKDDNFNGEVLASPGYGDGTLFVSSSYFKANATTGQYISYGKLYAIDANNGSVKWSYLDSNYVAATPAVANGTVYLPQDFLIQGFDTKTGQPNWGVGVTNGLPWTPLIDGDTLYTATASFSAGYYSIVAIDIKTSKTLWTTPVSYNPPGGIIIANGTLVFTAGTGGLMALNKSTGSSLWSVNDQQYDGIHVASGNTLFAFNHASPLGLYSFGLSTGGQIWADKMPKVFQFGGLWIYGKYVCAYVYDFPSSYVQMLDPKTGDSVSRATATNARYESPLLVGHRIYAQKTWDNITNRSLPTPQLAVLDAGSMMVKDSVVLTGAQQIKSMRVIGKSGAIY